MKKSKDISGKKLMKGNEAIVRAALRAGCRFYAGYPITPQNEIPEFMSKLMPDDGVFIQAEAELTAINMVFGASASGVRCMTSSSSPGISLKQEGISYIAAAELPSVIVNVSRGGPGLGNIRASQADYFQSVKGGGHGDYRLIVLAPHTPQEMYSITMDAFDYADYFRNPVLILADGVTGQMYEPVEEIEYKPKFKLPKKEWALTGCKDRKPNTIKTLLLDPPDLLVTHNKHLIEKYKKIGDDLSLFEEYMCEDAEIIVVSYGLSARVSREAIEKARKKGLRVGLFRPITLWPFPKKEISKYKGKKLLTVEMSNGQMIEDVKLSLDCKGKFYHLGWGGGWYPDTNQIIDKLEEIDND